MFTNWETPFTKSVKSNLLFNANFAYLFLLLFSFSLQKVQAQQDLSITQIASVDSAGVGDEVTFTITLMNDGTTTATGVTVKNVLPSNTAYLSHTASVGTFDSGTGIWIAGPNGDSSIIGSAMHTLAIVVELTAPGVHTNQVEVNTMNGFDIDSAPNDMVVTDDDYATACVSVPYKICPTFKDTIVLTAPDNYVSYEWLKDGVIIADENAQTYKAFAAGDYTFNAIADGTLTCRDSTCCAIQVEEACFDLALDKQLASVTSVTPGDDVTFTITIHNQGDFYADSILITDSLPTGLTNNSGLWIGNDTLLTIADGGLVAGGLAPGATKTVNITVTVDSPNSLDSLVNYAEISSAAEVSQTDNRDIDSTPDTNFSNDAGGGTNTAADNFIMGTGLGTAGDGIAATDEDDHDAAVVYLCPSITNPTATTNICSGETVDLSVTTTNSAANGISFVYFSSTQADPYITTDRTLIGTTSTASISDFSFPANTGTSAVTYFVYAIINPDPDMGACRPFQEIQVVVNPIPTLVDAPFTICASETSTDLTTNNTTILDGDAGTVAWYDGMPSTGTLITTATNLNTVTDLWALVTLDGTGCQDSVDVTVTINPIPTPVDAPFTICASETSTDLTTNNSTILDGDAGTVAWYDGMPSTGTLITTATNLNTVTDLWALVTLDGTGCQDSVDVTININPIPTPVDAPFTICASETSTDLTTNNSTILDGDAGTVAWYDGMPSTGTLITTATNLNTVTDLWALVTLDGTGCQDSVDVTVAINSLPSDALVVSDTTICSGGTAIIRVENPEAGVTYQLVRAGGTMGSPISDIGSGVTFSLTGLIDSVTYLIEVVNGSGCKDTLNDPAVINVPDCDFGDLPDASVVGNLAEDYLTTLADNGPYHFIRNDLYLGMEIDGETDATPEGMAKGDDDDITPDDEDGITFFNSLNIVPGGIIRLPISVTNGTGETAYLEGWIDWNGDGNLDVGERVVHEDDMTTAFPAFVEIMVPAVVADNKPIGVRFRLSLTDNMTPYGQATSGEIEDYLIQIDCATGVCIPISSTVIRGTKD